MGQIFISYRRSDASGHAGRLRDRLRAHFGEDVVFQDVDNIPDGEEFAKVIERALDSCKVALVIIGRNWVNAQTTQGLRRFDDPDDWVRTEVGILLRRGIRVVPVLVQGASLPRREDLPDELKDLARRNARELRDSAWDADMSLLLKSLEPVLGSRRKRNLAVAAGIAAVAVAGLMYFGPYVDIRVGEVAVPDLEGKTVELAREALIRDGFKNVHEETVPSAEFGKGRVVRTEPLAGASVSPKGRITVFVSGGVAEEKQPSGLQNPKAPPSTPLGGGATSLPTQAKSIRVEPAVKPRAIMDSEKYYRLQLKFGGQYMDAERCSNRISLNPGSDFEGGACQLWRLVPSGDGWFRLQLKHGGQYLDAAHCSNRLSLNPGSDWEGGACQLWRFVPAGNGWSRLQLKHGGQYVDAERCSNKLGLHPGSDWDGGSCQLWRLVPE